MSVGATSPAIPEPTVLLPQRGFLLRVTPTGWINIVQGDEDNDPPEDVSTVILSPQEAEILLHNLPRCIVAAGELHRNTEVPSV
jgi:hypothetical protein